MDSWELSAISDWNSHASREWEDRTANAKDWLPKERMEGQRTAQTTRWKQQLDMARMEARKLTEEEERSRIP
jgi:hypothetical protein